MTRKHYTNFMFPETRTYSTSQVSFLSGLTLRKLQYFDEQEVLQPLMNRNDRAYTYVQLIEAALIAKLRPKISLMRVRKVMNVLRRDVMRRVTEKQPLPADLCVITDGNEVKVGSAIMMIEWLKNCKGGAYLVEIAAEIRRVDMELEANGLTEPCPPRVNPSFLCEQPVV